MHIPHSLRILPNLRHKHLPCRFPLLPLRGRYGEEEVRHDYLCDGGLQGLGLRGVEEHVDWDGRDGAEGEQLGAERGEVGRVVKGEVVFLAVPVCHSFGKV